MDNPSQYYVKTSENKLNGIQSNHHHYQSETAPEYTELFNPNKDYYVPIPQRKTNQAGLSKQNSLNQNDGKKYQPFSTYKPILKSSNVSNNNNSSNINKRNSTVSNSFRTSKIDYV